MSSGPKKKSRSSRNETKSRGEDNAKWSEWSEWEWSDQKRCWMRTRANSNGDTNYQYGASQGQSLAAPSNAQPRTIPSPAPPLAEELYISGPVYSDTGYQNSESYGYAQVPDQGSTNQGWDEAAGSGSQPQKQALAQDSPYSNDLPSPTDSGTFSGSSVLPYSQPPDEVFHTLTSVQTHSSVTNPGLGSSLLPPSLLPFPGPIDSNYNPSGSSAEHSNSFQSGQISYQQNFGGAPSSSLPLHPADQITIGLGRVSLASTHGYTQNVSDQSFNMGTGLFETGSLSRFPQGTHHEQQGNAIRNSNEGTNVERIVSSVNEGDIDRGVGEGNDARDFEETQGVSQGLLRSKSIKNIVTLNPKIKEDPLYKEYRVHHSSEFQKGRVFKMLWSEPYGGAGANLESISAGTDEVFVKDAKFGEKVYSTIRRFVVAQKKKGHSVCVPVLTYGNRGTAKPGVKPEYHAIIYSSRDAPKELDGESKLFKSPIRVAFDSRREKLRPESRVNYSKIYTVEHNVKVCFIGRIHQDSEVTFSSDFERTFFEEE